MKMLRISLLHLFCLLTSFSVAQTNDTVNDVSSDCLDMKEVTNFVFLFEDDSINICGEILMNCNPINYLFREVREDSIFLIAADFAMASCDCVFAFETSLSYIGHDSCFISLGYMDVVTGYYRHDLDTVLYKPLGIGQIRMEDSRIVMSPNPIVDQLRISIEDSDEFINSIKVYQINGREVFTEFYHHKLNHQMIDFSPFKAGIYIIRIESDKEVIMKKLIKV